MFKLRMIGKIVKTAGLAHTSAVFLIVFFVCSLLVRLVEPGMNHPGDALWFCFQAVTTIGFGDIVAVTAAGRIITVVLCVTSIFFLAVLTGSVVSYCQEVMRARNNESIAQFIVQLENLPKLSSAELAELSEKVKRYHR